MGRILAIDYGRKRVGLAVTDPLRLIATGLDTVPSTEIFGYLGNYLLKEKVDFFIVGYPRQMNNELSDAVKEIDPFIAKLRRKFPTVPVEITDERFTSKMAQRAMLAGGLKKSDRRDKGMVDKLSAVIILQTYMEYNN